MNENYQIIDTKTWKRSAHFELFRKYAVPKYDVTIELDISAFYQMIKERDLPFTFAMIFAIAKCANEIEEFRYRFLDHNVVLYDRIHTSFVYLNSETELFKKVFVEMQDDIEDYVRIAKRAADEQQAYFDGPPRNDVYHFSPIPWLTYTHITHAFSGDRESAAPMFDWGKYYDKQGRLALPFSIQAHHSFVDGIHVSRFVERLQEYLNTM